MKEQTCCFTGHRKILPDDNRIIFERLEQAIVDAISAGYRYFGAGGALGFDTMAAMTVLRLKERYTHIRLILILPCPEQSEKFSDYDKDVYNYILEKSDKVVYTSSSYTRGCMHKRNRHLVDNSSLCIAYLRTANGGTAYTVDYAIKHNLRVVNLFT